MEKDSADGQMRQFFFSVGLNTVQLLMHFKQQLYDIPCSALNLKLVCMLAVSHKVLSTFLKEIYGWRNEDD